MANQYFNPNAYKRFGVSYDGVGVSYDPASGVGGSINTGDVSISGNQSGQLGIGTNIGGANVSLGYDASTGQAGAGVGVSGSTTTGNTTFGIGVGIGTSGITVSPTVQIGNDPGAAEGANYGAMGGSAIGAAIAGPIGAAIGSLVGSAAGSLIGGDAGPSIASQQRRRRDGIINHLSSAGVLSEDLQFTLPDGSVVNFGTDSAYSNRGWKDPSKRTNDGVGDRALWDYETDYTNDLDYIGHMFGVNLLRILGGTADHQEIDQIGSWVGNALLGVIGFGNDLTQENFEHVTNNARAFYAQAGITSKDDLLSIASKMYGDGRIDDSDYSGLQHIAALIYDNDFNTAQKLMDGRWNGIEEAESGETQQEQQPKPTQQAVTESGHARLISAEEARASIKPLIDYYRENLSLDAHGMNWGATRRDVRRARQGAIISGVDSLVEGVTGQGIGDWIVEGGSAIADWLFGDDTNAAVGGTNIDMSPMDLPTFDWSPSSTSSGSSGMNLPGFSWDAQ